MKTTKKIIGLILSLLVAFTGMISFSTVASAEEAKYTYTIKVVLGGTGEEGAAFTDAVSDKKISEDCLEFTGLNYGDSFNFTPQTAVQITPTSTVDDEGNPVELAKYYVKGFRRSGDKELAPSAIQVTGDETYVIAYGVGDVVPYTVKYQDEAGATLLDTVTYYGAEGEEVYVPYRYVEGYVPQMLNIHVKSLKKDQELVFTYKKIKAGTNTVYTETTNTEYSTVVGDPQYTYQIIPGQVAENAGIVTNRNPTAGGNAAAGDNGANNETAGDAAGDEETEIDDNQVPRGIEEIEEIPDEEVPEAVDNAALFTRYMRYLILIAIIGLLIATIAVIGTIRANYDKNNHN